jgi:D-glycero-alpha-D-manno-heptose-7-phosphate kinase
MRQYSVDLTFMEFSMDQNIVHPLADTHRYVLLELEESLVLCHTGSPHNSGDIHQDQRQQMQQHDVRLEGAVQCRADLPHSQPFASRRLLQQFGQALA